MADEGSSTITKLMELFHLSRSKGEWVSLSMESKDGNDAITFSLNNLSGSPARQAGNWTPASAPWTWTYPRPRMQMSRRRKTPCQLKRDQKRKTDFLAKKAASEDVKLENKDKAKKATIVDPEDEISLTEIRVENKTEEGSGHPDLDNRLIYNFTSEYTEEGIYEALEEIFPDKSVVKSSTLLSRVRRETRSAVHDCVLELRVEDPKTFGWPELKGVDVHVFKDMKKIRQ